MDGRGVCSVKSWERIRELYLEVEAEMGVLCRGWGLDLERCVGGVGSMLAIVKRLGDSPSGKVW